MMDDCMNASEMDSYLLTTARPGPSAPAFRDSPPPAIPAGPYVASKATWDKVAAVLLLIPALPVIGVCWLLVRLLNPGPGFYSQTRLGKDGVPYPIIKIRTMRHDVEKHTGGARWSTAGDTRVFAFGRFLRKTHLDELPQLFNVLRGHMSLVGPRPERPEIIAALNLIKQVPGYEHRLMVKPGVTGLAQLQLPADSDILSVRNKVEYDLFYIERQSFWLDLRLVLATAAKAIGVGHKGIRRFFFLPRKDDVAEVFATRVSLTDSPSGRFQPA
jgi:lipopolysaccharide/colanic/teichoic acid biosynthesis glycosyltransferase